MRHHSSNVPENRVKCMPLQPKKALDPIESVFFGIVISVMLEHWLNAEAPMVFRMVSKETLDMLLQP